MRIFLLILKVVISVALLVLLFRYFPMEDVFSRVGDMRWELFAAAVVLGIGIWYLQALRWKRTMPDNAEGKPSLKVFLYYTAIGYFFNLLLPSGIGGDAIKSVAYGKRFKMTASSVASVLMSRVMGGSLMLATFWLAFLLWKDTLPRPVILGMAFLSLIALLGWIFLLGPWQFHFLKNHRWQHLREYRMHLTLMGRSWWETIGVQILTILQQWVFFLIVGVDMSVLAVALFLPPVFLLTLIPVSLFGVGVREWATVGLYTLSGHSAAECLAATGPAYLMVFLQAALGGLWLVIHALQQSARSSE